LKIKPEIPLIGSSKTETGIDIELQRSQTWTTDVKSTFSVSKEFTIAPKKKFAARAIIQFVEGAKLPVKVKVRASLQCKRLQELDYEGGFRIVTEPAPGEFLQNFLNENKVGGRIVSVEGNNVIFETEADVTTSYGLSTSVDAHEEDL